MSFTGGYNSRTQEYEQVAIVIIGFTYEKERRSFFVGGYSGDGNRIKSFITQDAAFRLSQQSGIPITPPPSLDKG